GYSPSDLAELRSLRPPPTRLLQFIEQPKGFIIEDHFETEYCDCSGLGVERLRSGYRNCPRRRVTRHFIPILRQTHATSKHLILNAQRIVANLPFVTRWLPLIGRQVLLRYNIASLA